MKTLWKFKVSFNVIDPDVPEEISMPDGATVLSHIEIQANCLFFWALVNTSNPMTIRKFRIVGTGWELSDDFNLNHSYSHIGSSSKDNFVWHLFEKL